MNRQNKTKTDSQKQAKGTVSRGEGDEGAGEKGEGTIASRAVISSHGDRLLE